MKDFIKGKWFPFLLLLVGLVVVLLGGFLLGFRITYAPALENSWEAISGVAAWVSILVSVASVGASFVAVWAAIQVPKKIAEQQNKIALFEKRNEIYEIVFTCAPFSKQIANAKNWYDIQQNFYIAFCYDVWDTSKIEDSEFLMIKYLLMSHKMNSISFVFKNREIVVQIKKLQDMLNSVVVGAFQKKNIQDLNVRIQNLSDYIDSENYKKLIKAMQKELNLN